MHTLTTAEAECGYCTTMARLTRHHQHRAELLALVRHEIRDCDAARSAMRPWFDAQYNALATHDPIETAAQRDAYIRELHQRWHDEHQLMPYHPCGLRPRTQLAKTGCRTVTCSRPARVLVSDTVCSALLCEPCARKFHAHLKRQGQGERYSSVPAAQCVSALEDQAAAERTLSA
ncbi:hypothetical protein [Nocardia sp. NBC_00511]|uniref:hypothetical protein n=1 Tax=Nocardia sp. NBC_00511 TaxID=2903591 RepID=UPI002F906BA7